MESGFAILDNIGIDRNHLQHLVRFNMIPNFAFDTQRVEVLD